MLQNSATILVNPNVLALEWDLVRVDYLSSIVFQGIAQK